MSWIKSFKAQVRIRWWAVTIFNLGLIVACYAVMQAAIQPLFGYKENAPFNLLIPVLSSLWFTRIWFGIALLLDRFIMSLYIHNSDTELWQMGDIEITKRIAAYEAELNRRKVK